MFRIILVKLTNLFCIFSLLLGISWFSSVQAAQLRVTLPASILTALPVSLTGGFKHSCVLMNDGSVKCWGANRFGQLGNSVLNVHPFPIPVAGLAGTASAIAAGSYHTCALISGGTVQCWGLNTTGQLGDGSTSNSTTPVTASGLVGVTAIAAGYAYTCALVQGGASGAVQCWGDNTFGQLGNGSYGGPPATLPGPVPGLTGVAAVTAGLDHTCVLMNDHTSLQCWGKNAHGQLGTGTVSATPSTIPVAVALPLPAGVTINAISAGAQHTCALLSSGSVYCWGDGALGEMGDNAPANPQNPTPTQVFNLNDAVAISAGGNGETGHTCALTSGGGVRCWGSNAYGQLGDGTHINRNAPVAVNDLAAGAAAIQVGINHSCVLMTDATIKCWGMDGSGQLGDGVVFITPTAIDAGGFNSGVTLLGTGDLNTCALVNGLALCWGDNRNGQLGDGSLVDRPAPVLVSGLTGSVTAIDSGLNQSCAVTNGGVQCWGRLDPNSDVINPPAAISTLEGGVTSLSVTNLSGCAVTNGAARCWGDNTYGQLGNGTISPSYTAAVAVSALGSGVAAVSTGLGFGCALNLDQTVWCWGLNNAGQIGKDPVIFPSISVPVQVTGLPLTAALAAGQDHVCALAQNGAVWCWGNNTQGQLGDGGLELATFIPVQVTGLTSGVSSLTAGGYHTCALVSGAVECWGFNSSGQLGNGLTTLSKVPVAATGLGSMALVNAGGVEYDQEQTCAVTPAGGLKCWGGDEYGQLGDNLPIQRTSPVRVVGWSGAPELGLNYILGAPGSYFRMAAANFPPGASLSLKINHHSLAVLQANAEGYAIFHIQVTQNVAAALLVEVSVGAASASSTITVDLAAPIRVQEGSGAVYPLNDRFIFFPSIMR